MGFYREWIVPALIDLSMRNTVLRPYRARVAGAVEGRVLDVGVGSGLNLPFYAGKPREIFGLDPSPRLLARAQTNAVQAQCPVHLIEGSAECIPFADHSVDTIVMTWCDGPTPTNTSPGPNEEAIVQYSTNRGSTWTRIGNGAEAGDRPDFPAIAISPDGRDVYLVYMAFLVPWQTTTASPRPMQGVVRHADFAGAATSFTTLHRGPSGDARGSSANSLTGEFLGDYNYAFATNAYAVATWNDVRNAADCPAVDAYRQSLMTETTADDLPAPAPATDCPPPTSTTTFGNSDIFGASYADPSSP